MTTADAKSRAACGPRTELAKNDAVRITRCPCGTIHLHFTRSGVSLQLAEDALGDLARASAEALGDIEMAGRAGQGSTPTGCMN